METKENNYSLLHRFFIYQKERFPFLAHGLLISAFSFSAISYSRICRGAEGFVAWPRFLVAIFTTVTLFFLVRVFDEFKDKEDDAMYRKHLPVPRGLIKLKELAVLGAIAAVLQITINGIFFPKMLLIYFSVIAYLCLMGKEFFVHEWLKKHQFWYVVSHMMIIPLIDIYASGMDWLMEDKKAPTGLLFFFAVSFMNGVVLEIGRKIKTPEKEEFNTYSTMMGMEKATKLWILILFITFCVAVAAAWFAGFGLAGFITLLGFLVLCSLPAVLFLKKKTAKLAKMIEYASALWTVAMYLSLGGVPMLMKLLNF
ncbi:MAG: UbiA family prenyltransferase [Bacteroidia bacterium]|nr:UbiA family prenyltransferase [Bacteroidia bacterium]